MSSVSTRQIRESNQTWHSSNFILWRRCHRDRGDWRGGRHSFSPCWDRRPWGRHLPAARRSRRPLLVNSDSGRLDLIGHQTSDRELFRSAVTVRHWNVHHRHHHHYLLLLHRLLHFHFLRSRILALHRLVLAVHWTHFRASPLFVRSLVILLFLKQNCTFLRLSSNVFLFKEMRGRGKREIPSPV